MQHHIQAPACLCMPVSSACFMISRHMFPCWQFKPSSGSCCLCRCDVSSQAVLRLFCRPVTLSGMSTVSWWTCCISETELAMMKRHRRAAAGEMLCCRSSSCLYALDHINWAENVIRPVFESYWWFVKGYWPRHKLSAAERCTTVHQVRSLSTR